jgi:hypothetical protein
MRLNVIKLTGFNNSLLVKNNARIGKSDSLAGEQKECQIIMHSKVVRHSSRNVGSKNNRFTLGGRKVCWVNVRFIIIRDMVIVKIIIFGIIVRWIFGSLI